MRKLVPAPTMRLRLTLLYGALFLASGAILLAITYLLVRHSTDNPVLVRGTGGKAQLLHLPQTLQGSVEHARLQAVRQHAAELHQLLVQSGIALAITAVISIVLGWLVAGRALRPIRTMTTTARQISTRNLHERLAMGGPRDELKDLADTFDGMLGRIETAFDAQRRFVANAAHELRTPLTLQRALLEETLGDPEATTGAYRSMSERLVRVGEDQERMIEALLTLARSERGIDHREPVDLASLVGRALPSHPGLRVTTNTAPAPTSGDRALLDRLVANLMDNAVRHNVPGGHIDIETGTTGDRAFLVIANTGPVIPPDDVARLFEPFQRLGADRTSSGEHHGLGLSIVAAIATAHGAAVTAHARPEGGLTIRVELPRAAHTSRSLPTGTSATMRAWPRTRSTRTPSRARSS